MRDNSEPPLTTGATARIAYAACHAPYVYYCADIISDAAAFASMPGFVVCTVARLESFVLRGIRRVIAVSDGVTRCAYDMGVRDVVAVPNGVRAPEAAATSTPEGFPTCSDPVFVHAGIVAQWLAPEVFVDAFERARMWLGDAHLVFVGQGSGWDALAGRLRGVTSVEMTPAVSTEGADWWMARAIATLASLRPGGHDYTYPTKILASFAQGTPVIYAGPGQAAHDIAEGELGVTRNLNADKVVEAMAGLVSGTATWVSTEGVCAWVSMHWPAEASSRAVAVVVQSAPTQTLGFSPSG